jgi:hypothetical protein
MKDAINLTPRGFQIMLANKNKNEENVIIFSFKTCVFLKKD